MMMLMVVSVEIFQRRKIDGEKRGYFEFYTTVYFVHRTSPIVVS